jgi:hypothetical protein
LSVSTKDPLMVPTTVGTKLTSSVQVLPEASEPEDELLET